MDKEPILVQDLIVEIRGQKVILDSALARLYKVETRTLKQAVRRNIDRFPEDFMFELSIEESNTLFSRSHFVTLNDGRGSTQGLNRMYLQNRALQCYLQFCVAILPLK